jgi:hypothetical protein
LQRWEERIEIGLEVGFRNILGGTMRRSVITMSVLVCINLGAVLLKAQEPAHQSQAVKVFVNPFEGPDKALNDMLNAKLIGHLVKHGIAVTESVDDATAVLNCSGVIQRSTSEYGNPRILIQAGVRLVDKDGGVIWADDVVSSRYSHSASTSFAEIVAKNLEQALAARAQKK